MKKKHYYISVFLFILFFIRTVSGQECGLLYVSSDGLTSGSAGTRERPAELNYALRLLNKDIRHLYLANGRYELNNTLSLHSDLILEGGFEPRLNWSKTNASATVIIRKAANPSDSPFRITGIEGLGVSKVEIRDINLSVENLTALGNGCSSYAVYLSNTSDYLIHRCNFYSGDAADGTPGTNGGNGENGANGMTGGSGDEDGGCCRDGGSGGNGWSAGSAAGGRGGTGGQKGEPLRVFPPSPGRAFAGEKGTNGNSERNLQGGGGSPGQGTTTIVSTGCNNDGQNSMNGSTGESGKNGRGREVNPSEFDGNLGIQTHINGFFKSGNGSDGKNGEPGGGGGGGGGGGSQGGVAILPGGADNNGAGGGGGGGGEGGQGGRGGAGGGGGGGTFGIYVHNGGRGGEISYSSFNVGAFGKGARGGTGGFGGRGGTGGKGGATDDPPGSGRSCDVGMGGDGGAGGSGGTAGNGGDGSDGISLSVYLEGIPYDGDSMGISLNDEPIITAGSNGCTHYSLPLEIESSGEIIWNFGDKAEPSTAKGSKVKVKYLTQGRKTIEVKVNGVAYSYVNYINIRSIGEDLNPKLICSQDSICAGMRMRMRSSLSALKYRWTINGVTIDEYANNQRIDDLSFTDEGMKRIRLETYSECCGWSEPSEHLIYIKNGLAPLLNIFNKTGEVCSGQPITFEAESLNAGVSPLIIWYRNLTVLPETGKTLILRDYNPGDRIYAATQVGVACGFGDTIYSPEYVIKVKALPAFINFPDNNCFRKSSPANIPAVDLPFSLKINESNSDTLTYIWDFGNGRYGIGKEVTVLYSLPGTYEIKIKSRTRLGCESEICVQKIMINNRPQASFEPNKTFGCMPLSVMFTNRSKHANKYSWDFGDGSAFSSEESPVYIYKKAGIYVVRLVSTFDNESDTVYSRIIVHPKPQSDFTSFEQVIINSDDSVQFASKSAGASIYMWDFGDLTTFADTSRLASPTYFYSTEGTFTVKLVVINEFGCTDTSVKNNFISRKISLSSRFLQKNSSIGVYPNPASDFIQIRLNEIHEEEIYVKIFDMGGREVYACDFENNNLIYITGLNKLNPGVYRLDVRTETKVYPSSILLLR